MFTPEELEAMRLADEEIEREFAESEEEIREAELRDGNLHAIRNLDKWERQREHARQKARERYWAHREEIKAANNAYYHANKEMIAAKSKQYYKKNKTKYQKNAKALVEKNMRELPVQIQVIFQRFFTENRISRDTFAKTVGVARNTAYEWGYRKAKPNTKKIRAVYPALADELDRIMGAA